MRQFEDSSSSEAASSEIPCERATIWRPPLRPRWSTAGGGRVPLYPVLGGQGDALARGRPLEEHLSQHHRQGDGKPLVYPLWYSSPDSFGQGDAVHELPVHQPVLLPGDRTHTHNSVPSPIKWTG